MSFLMWLVGAHLSYSHMNYANCAFTYTLIVCAYSLLDSPSASASPALSISGLSRIITLARATHSKKSGCDCSSEADSSGTSVNGKSKPSVKQNCQSVLMKSRLTSSGHTLTSTSSTSATEAAKALNCSGVACSTSNACSTPSS